jgi:flavin reductase (DIM6/NTAB) family NADH-FMN oxidoreductase RutF
MTKVDINPRTTGYPMPVVIVGATVDSKPNFMAVAWFTKVNSNPPMILIAIGKNQYTGEGIKKNKTFSINLPGKNMVVETDYVGIVSGRKEDKSRPFNVFYRDPKIAPMIKECPLNYELKLVDTVEVPGSNLFIGEIINAYVDQEKIQGNQPDLPAIEPFMLVETPATYYYSLGSQIADAFKVGKKLSTKKLNRTR